MLLIMSPIKSPAPPNKVAARAIDKKCYYMTSPREPRIGPDSKYFHRYVPHNALFQNCTFIRSANQNDRQSCSSKSTDRTMHDMVTLKVCYLELEFDVSTFVCVCACIRNDIC